MKGLVLIGPVGTFTWRMLATVLGGQAIAVFFGTLVARSLAAANDEGTGTAYLIGGSALAVACLVAAGLMRGRWGVPLGWLVQVATLLSAVVVPMMVAVTLIFGGLWVLCMVQGARVEERMDAARRERAHSERSGGASADEPADG